MRLLVVTQVVDQHDPVLGFFHRWLETLAENVESVEVICLRKGTYTLPKNVHVHSLGKEEGARTRISYALSFLMLAYRLRNKYDAVFVHMNPEYIVLAGILWKWLRKPIGLWYTHKQVSITLRIAEYFADMIFTASSESFRLKSTKCRVMGHGIEYEAFQLPRTTSSVLRLISIGRVSATKRIREMLEAVACISVPCTFTIVGEPATKEDREYKEELDRYLAAQPWKESVVFTGPVGHKDVPALLANADVFCNLSTTGSLDKAVLEAIAAGVVPVTSNEAFRAMLPEALMVSTTNPQTLATMLETAPQVDISSVRQEVKERHALSSLIRSIMSIYNDVCAR